MTRVSTRAAYGRIARVTTRRAVALVLVLVVVPALFVAEQAVETLYTLERVEQQRDTWQRPEQILQRLNLRSGLTVVDLGSGAGYFALKIAPLVQVTSRKCGSRPSFPV